MDNYVWDILEKDVNAKVYNTIDLLKAAIVKVMPNINQQHLIKAYKQFRSRVEAVIQANGGFIE